MEPGRSPDTPERTDGLGEESTRTGLPDLGDGRYVIQESIGYGGMGEVYRALDRQLGRTVAIKTIHASLASRPDVVRRLAREARYAASLDHPFICKVHELLEREDGQALLVMEYVEGQTLKALLKNGALDLATTVRIAREVAEALNFAHQRNVIHRDIKPANIMATPHGHIKVMDFGIAKTFVTDPELSATSALTAEGRVVGSPAYMSPEQAAGDHVDHRSDIFSFGVVLHECLAGRLPFDGATKTEYLRAAATAEPKALPRHLPAELRAIVLRCLAKSPDERFGSFDTVRKELDAVSLSLISATSNLTFSQRLRLGPRPWVVAVVLAITAGFVYVTVEWLRPRDEAAGGPLTQDAVVTWPSVEDGSRISPDGTKVAFTSNQGGGSRLWIRSATGNEPKAITNAHDAIKTPAWSSTGEQIAYLFRSEGRAWVQIVSSWGESAGPARPLGGAWDDVGLVRWIGGRIYFGLSSGGAANTLWRHEVATGTDAQVSHPSGRPFVITGQTVNVDVRRDERSILFAGRPPEGGLWTADLDGRNATRIPIEANPVVTPRWRGNDGTRIVYVANENGQMDVWEYNLRTKRRTPLTTSPLEEEAVDISESGAVIVADTIEQISHLWALAPDGGSAASQLTNDSRSDLWPSVSRSGKLVFHRRRGSFIVYTPDDTEVITAWWSDHKLQPGAAVGPGASGSISSDGRRVFFVRWTEASAEHPELWVKDLDSLNPARLLWKRFAFGSNHAETWVPMGQNATWAPRSSDEIFFAGRTDSEEVVVELVRARLNADLSARFDVLATCSGQDRFSDLAVSDDAASIAFVLAPRRPYRGGAVQLLDLRQSNAIPRTILEAGDGALLFVRGWTRRGTIVVLKSLRPDRENATEIWEIHPQGRKQRIAVIPGLLAMTSRFDAVRDRLFVTGIRDGHASVRLVSLPTGTQKTIVPNVVDGVTFAGFGVTADGWLLYMRKDTNKDVWLFNFAGRQRAGATQETNR